MTYPWPRQVGIMEGNCLSSVCMRHPLVRPVVFALFTGTMSPAWTAPACEQRFDHDDPRLFEFVDTRQRTDYSELEGRRIGAIDYVVLPIFNSANPDENNWLYTTFNFLHVDTRHNTLKKQMILQPGETLDARRVAENERILRNNKYLSDVMILPHRVCPGSVDLLVVVRDVWTLSPSASVSRSGGENSSGAGISEDNLLGTGQEVSLGYFQEADRSGRSISYRSPQLFNNHSSLHLGYGDNSDGEVVEASLERPFYELDSTWSAGARVYRETREEDIEQDGQVVNTYQHNIHNYEVFYGWSAGLLDGRVQRWRVGFTEEEDLFGVAEGTPSTPPENRRTRYPWVSWESLENRYLTTSNITYSHRQEDLLLGASHFARLGYAPRVLGSSENAAVFIVSSGYTASFGEHHLLRVGASSSGRFVTDGGEFASTFVGGSVSYYNFIDRQNRWYAQFRFDSGKNIRLDEQLTSGGNDTLRGYPEDIQRGNRRWVFTAERRHFTDIHLLNLAWLGGAAYVDVGQTWDTETPDAADSDVLANLGLGLRFSPSKFRIDKVLHVDIAVPLSERENIDSYQVIVAGEVDF